MRKLIDNELLALNPQIDMQRVADFEKFRRELEQSGVDLAPQYRLIPPLGELVSDESVRSLSGDSRRRSQQT